MHDHIKRKISQFQDSEMRDTIIEEFKVEHEQWKYAEQEKIRVRFIQFVDVSLDWILVI